ncbi:MAG: hypothetical protein WBK77_05205 [Alphaproteobacteria bacterium]
MFNKTELEKVREEFARFLPVALRTVKNSYALLMDKSYQNGSKDHKEYHAAQNVCVTHIVHLIKLSSLISPEKTESAEFDFSGIIAAAQKEIDE